MYQKMNINNISDKLIKNEFEIQEFKKVRYSQLEEIELLYQYGENSMCEILFNNQTFLGTGFFIQIESHLGIPIKKALLTSNKIFPDDFFFKNKEYLYFNHKGKNKKIDIKDCQVFSTNINYIDFRKGFNKRKIFISKELDYTFIEILDSDCIFDKDYTLFKIDFLKDSSDITILHYPNSGELSFSFGTFIKKNNDTLVHNCYFEYGSVGAPIINRNNNQSIIGIHYGIVSGLGHFMDTIFCDIKNNYNECIFKENSLKNNFQTLIIHNNFITNLILLDNNILCSCSTDGSIIFINANNYGILGKIKEKAEIIYHTKLSNNNIILCCNNGTIKIYK